MNQPHQNYSVPIGKSLNPFIIPNIYLVHAQREDDQKKMETRRCKVAREQRRQKLQKIRSTRASKAREVTIEKPPIYRGIQKRIPHVFFTSDGKRFEEILTKKLRNSDVNKLGRIVLPKREAEEKLPTPSKEGIEVVFKDIHYGLEWKVKFKYWINVKTKMYVLENTANLVKHYGLCMGDYLSLYEDESKNLYLYTEKGFCSTNT
ncbi:B3 domain-containing transcription factor LEC2 [Vicia villosa]|uniref:B3 domain-containing transcription factor LEC2 n=1 Tax=Vicia villosa TaxID=3911 RepID=UPI00273A84C9|nr:B3 domain-containing transcription factor LEC2 [Vicia villosa]